MVSREKRIAEAPSLVYWVLVTWMMDLCYVALIENIAAYNRSLSCRVAWMIDRVDAGESKIGRVQQRFLRSIGRANDDISAYDAVSAGLQHSYTCVTPERK